MSTKWSPYCRNQIVRENEAVAAPDNQSSHSSHKPQVDSIKTAEFHL